MIEEQKQVRKLRWLPGLIIVALQWLIRFGTPLLFPGDNAVLMGVFGGILGGLALVIWWLFFSRAPGPERWGAVPLMILALIVSAQFIDVSIATANMGLMFTIFSIPVMSLAFVLWAVASRRFSTSLRRISLLLTIILASGGWILLRTNGMTSDLHQDFTWRWAPTAEERFLARAGTESLSKDTSTATNISWQGFRGANRDGIIHGVKIKTDWKVSPPAELWRRAIGPGCSSFAVRGDLIYTQEQRGEEEVVSCYDLASGKPVWIHPDKARFWDSHTGAGPRATPALSGDRIYTLGATGILNALDATTGSLIWSRNAALDTKATNSGWGFTASPLVVGNQLIVAVSGKLAAYELTTGKESWMGPDSARGYSSPQLMTIHGIDQVLLMSNIGVTSLSPANGKLLWNYSWPVEDRILQPAFVADGHLLLSSGSQEGIRRINVSPEGNGWKLKEVWSSSEFSPSFNDFVIHKGYAYGFNGRALTCMDLKDGKRIWQGGRYGGQLLLLADQDLLLLLSEKGNLVLVSATPDQFTEKAIFPAIKGRTWNHPVLAGDVLLVRNSLEMAAFRLSLATAN
jgi:outer membrane protein assembly factor BamB